MPPARPRPDRKAAHRLLESVEDALEMLRDYVPAEDHPPVTAPLPSLLDRCEALCRDLPAPAPLRTIHHFARTGGTLISRGLSAMPNVALLSEVDPLSTLSFGDRAAFAPTDLIRAARTNFRPADDATATAMFRAGITALYDAVTPVGQHLVLRDHAHTHFCTGQDYAARATLRDMLARDRNVISVVTVRNPLHSWISLRERGWIHFAPQTLQEYARRYTAFLDRYADLEIYRYEDFLADPDATLRAICSTLALPFAPDYQDLLSIVPMTGDDRPAGRIRRDLPRRTIPDALRDEIEATPGFADLCRRLGYDPQAAAEAG